MAIKAKLKTIKIDPPIELGCDYWFNASTKCANAAVVYVSRNGDECKACEHHRAKLAKVVGKPC